ncbi:hypothetical protein [Psychrobacter aquimaris]|uniref:hypothetical protein n=1 Tax=Psychrobacter TaxID=497 RepID=UPI0039C6B897|tara:strand:- start:210 stop:539 length:330 start_codon:yes stop_codon:yes gene_type:complete
MSLNMHYKSGLVRKAHCQISDDLLPTLYQIHDNAKFPRLTWLINSIYENPQIRPEAARELANEMVEFEKLILSLHLPFPRLSLQKIHAFFEGAATSQQIIYTKAYPTSD